MAGVFVLVGLASASIILWIFFAVRRRRRTRRLEHDTAVSATLAAAGFHRTPLDDDDDPGASSRRSRYGSPDYLNPGKRSSSGLAMSSVPSAGRASAVYLDEPNAEYNPYTDRDYIVPAGSRDGYISGTPHPPSAFLMGSYRDRNSSGGGGETGAGFGHSSSGSGTGSFEPLLASYHSNLRDQGAGSPPPPPRAQAPTPPPAASTIPPQPTRMPSSEAIKYPPAYSATEHQNYLTGGPIQSNNGANPNPTIVATAAPGPGSDTSSEYSNSGDTADDRLDPGLRHRLRHEDDDRSTRDLRDDQDYSRPVLGVRNLPDGASQHSVV